MYEKRCLSRAYHFKMAHCFGSSELMIRALNYRRRTKSERHPVSQAWSLADGGALDWLRCRQGVQQARCLRQVQHDVLISHDLA